MPLSTWGGLAQGISAGLRDVAAIQGMKQNMIAGERAEKLAARQDTMFNQDQALRAEGEKEINLDEWSARMGPEVQGYIKNTAMKLGFGDSGTIKQRQAREVVKHLDSNPQAQYEMLQLKQRGLEAEVGNLNNELRAFLDEGEGGLGMESVSQQLKQKQDELNRLRYQDAAWVKEQEAGHRERTYELESRKVDALFAQKSDSTPYMTKDGKTVLINERDPRSQQVISEQGLVPATVYQKPGTNAHNITEVPAPDGKTAQKMQYNTQTNRYDIPVGQPYAVKSQIMNVNNEPKITGTIAVNPTNGQNEYLMTDGSFSGRVAGSRPTGVKGSDIKRVADMVTAAGTEPTPSDIIAINEAAKQLGYRYENVEETTPGVLWGTNTKSTWRLVPEKGGVAGDGAAAQPLTVVEARKQLAEKGITGAAQDKWIEIYKTAGKVK